ncbi:hypothetical protein [Nocardia sp. NPDC051570]|uniref:hypothetical protein n=1 Tax=Nocardia sp. NPDC051570 TaxID=3364324 RepID=UPI00379CAABD
MADIVEALQARCAETAGEAIFSGDRHLTLTLSAHEVADLLDHISNVHRHNGALGQAATDAVSAFERIGNMLHYPTADPYTLARQARSIARSAVENLTATEGVVN